MRELVGAVAGPHPRSVAGPLRKPGAAGRDQASQDRSRRAFADRDDAGDQLPVLGDVDDLAVSYSCENFACVVAQVAQSYSVTFRTSHVANVSHFCITPRLGAVEG